MQFIKNWIQYLKKNHKISQSVQQLIEKKIAFHAICKHTNKPIRNLILAVLYWCKFYPHSCHYFDYNFWLSILDYHFWSGKLIFASWMEIGLIFNTSLVAQCKRILCKWTTKIWNSFVYEIPTASIWLITTNIRVAKPQIIHVCALL